MAHERGNHVTVINTGNPNDADDDVVEDTVTGSAGQLVFLKKPIDIVTKP